MTTPSAPTEIELRIEQGPAQLVLLAPKRQDGTTFRRRDFSRQYSSQSAGRVFESQGPETVDPREATRMLAANDLSAGLLRALSRWLRQLLESPWAPRCRWHVPKNRYRYVIGDGPTGIVAIRTLIRASAVEGRVEVRMSDPGHGIGPEFRLMICLSC